jgi:hypothetical protein
MIYRCPICGDWCEYYSLGQMGYWLQTDNQFGETNVRIRQSSMNGIPSPFLLHLSCNQSRLTRKLAHY